MALGLCLWFWNSTRTYASRLKQPALGIELDHDRAVASCLNLNTIAHRYSTFDQGWHRRSLVLATDGTASDEIASIVGLEANSVALLMLDPKATTKFTNPWFGRNATESSECV